MSRIGDIFLLARDTLGDLQKQRYTDDTLFRNLILAIKDIAIQTNLFKNIIDIPLIDGTATYQMPDGILNLSHVTYLGEALQLVSSGWMLANKEIAWRSRTVDLTTGGKLELAIYDEVKRKQIAVYPRPFNNFTSSYVSEPNEYGLVGNLETEEGLYDQPSPYGVIDELVDSSKSADIQTSAYGVVTAIEDEGVLTIYYSRCPPLPIDINDDFELDECFDAALKFYICGTALRNDVDAQNRQFGAEEFALYQRDVDAIIQLAHVDSVAAAWFESHYNPMG